MPDLGIGEGLAALFGGGDILGGLGGLGALFGGGGAAAADVGAGTAAGLGAADVGAGAAAGAGAADLGLGGTGTALFGGTTGLEGTALAGGAGTDLAALTATPGLGIAGTAADFLAAPGAVGAGLGAADALGGFGAGADAAAQTAAQTGLASGVGGAGAAPTSISDLLSSGAVSPGAGFNVQPVASGGTTGVGGGTASTGGPSVMGTAQGYVNPGVAPAAPGATSIAPPPGVGTGAIDPTAAAAGGTTAAPATGAAPAAAPSSVQSLLSKAGGAVGDAFSKNPIGMGLGAAGLGYSVLKGQQDTSNMKALSATAQQEANLNQQLTAQGENLQQYLTSGTLPPQYMAQVNQAVQSAKAKAIADAAAQGLNTDPTKNSALAATLSNIDNQVPQMIAQVGQTLAQSGQGLINAGAGAAGLQSNLYQALVQNDTANASAIGRSIASLAAALSGKTQANIGGQTVTVS